MNALLDQQLFKLSKSKSDQLYLLSVHLYIIVAFFPQLHHALIKYEKFIKIAGSTYCVAPKVLHMAYGTEADVWSVGVIAHILLCGSCPFWP
ncbi:putative protein kinase CAMK-CDPK family [Rosa chinensis]|uniref:Protein kinase domain-containing protein n=1 Tax=Rosa chinensis TaxID=74649 RepID=A0A2P6RPP1_ROSCH|nr:putative protein kinase CAMK-CDPK family [Rosa chinensis]